MSHAADLPLWAAILVAFFLLLGAGLTLIGSYGFFRLRSFYDRIHAPTLGTSWGTAALVLASMICFSVLQSRPSSISVTGIVTVTKTPIRISWKTGRAALYRDRAEGNPDVPPMDPPKGSLVATTGEDAGEGEAGS